jgi:hypothetical protein
MATRQQIARLEARIEQIALASDPAVTVTAFAGESAEFAVQRHCQLRPEHTGRRMKIEQRREPRDKVAEMFAACSQAEIKAVYDAILAKRDWFTLPMIDRRCG